MRSLAAMRVLSVVGNRPQFVKSAPLSVALRDRGIQEVLLHTGQHYDRELSDVFFEELQLPEPDIRLELHTAETDVMSPPILDAIRQTNPDAVLVYGDTNSTLAGAVAAVEAAVPIAHVEAGLRSGDLSMPEERNRIEVDRLAAILFAPDVRSRRILEAEGVSRPDRSRRRRDGGRDEAARSACATTLADCRRARPDPRALSGGDSPPRGEHTTRPAAADRGRTK